jgi:TonB family protein
MQYEKSFSRYLLYSFLLHLLTFIIAFFLSESHWLRPPPLLQVTWVQLGGLTGKEEGLPYKESKTLPQTTIEEQKNVNLEKPPPEEKTPTPEKTPVGEEKEKVVIEEKKPKEKKIEEIKETAEKKPEGKPYREDPRIKEALAKINEDLKKPPVIPEAAQVKEGATGDVMGNPGGSNSECALYSARVKQKIVGSWIHLIGGAKPPQPPKIFASINASGEVISTQWIQKSGDQSLDMSALRAIQNASPFPPPPLDCQAALSGGITVQFGR